MDETNDKKEPFVGTYFDPRIIFGISNFSRVVAWVVLVVYAVDFLLSIAVIILQISRGFWVGMGATDMAATVLIMLEKPFRGLVYFVLLLGFSEVLKLFVDMENNTRRAARSQSK
jgi:hypothetical protein